MGQRYLIDTNVLIDYTGGMLPENGGDFVENLFNTDFLTSVVVKIELLGFNHLPEKLSFVEQFLGTATILPLDDAVTKRTILLRQRYKKFKLGDSIIAATALTYELILITNNIKDFANVKGLKLLNPHQI
ncbi:MAG: type II toxin-antitoxin system VapC family toxin [Bacteroidota bacterium]|nr:type II toxin-antitoxin system VapC family toxin [Bacteroidota bacterium]